MANPEVQAEFGAQLPACMVPIGTKTLLEAQVQHAMASDTSIERVFVGLPEDATDTYSEIKNVEFHYVLTDSMDATFQHLMMVFLDWAANGRESVFLEEDWRIHVLNGDTLITDLRAGDETSLTNAFYVKETTAFGWKRGAEKDYVYAGKLSFRIKLPSNMDSELVAIPSYAKVLENCEEFQLTKENIWFDFGHIHTYYRSKRDHMSSRSFNQVGLQSGRIVKRGPEAKIRAEIEWFKKASAINSPLRFYLPQVLGNANTSYTMEYLAMPTLGELFVYGSHDRAFWKHVAGKLKDLLHVMRDYAPIVSSEDDLMLAKTEERVRMLRKDMRDPAMKIIEVLRTYAKNMSSVVHGDLCFSNILYDARSDQLKIIDPRGIGGDGKNSIFGSQIYDMAKLLHSSSGLYDFAVANKTPATPTLPAHAVTDMLFEYCAEVGIPRHVLIGVTALLFYSMLPLHQDDMERVSRLAKRATSMDDWFWRTHKLETK
jgi:hypothetical protein